jgi:hypothetical protein
MVKGTSTLQPGYQKFPNWELRLRILSMFDEINVGLAAIQILERSRALLPKPDGNKMEPTRVTHRVTLEGALLRLAKAVSVFFMSFAFEHICSQPNDNKRNAIKSATGDSILPIGTFLAA